MIENFAVRLDILSDALVKKEDALLRILDITENQSTVLESTAETSQWKEFFAAMNEEKQTFIDIVVTSDDIFDRIFKEFGDEFEKNAANHKDVIQRLQEQIKAVTDLDIKIRVCEERNRMLMGKSRIDETTMKINVPKASKNYILKQYINHNKKG